VLLSDMVMPRMSGPELAAKIKTLRPDVKILFMSGYSEYSNVEISRLSPQPSVLQKPFSVGSLVERVREILASESVEVGKAPERCVT
jgi:two-component system cell cycle sensor histidine kinase/response regulator CckA